MTERLSGKVALITGAARGQGRSHAIRVAEEGADVIALDICRQIESVPYPMATKEDLEETERLVEKTGQRVVTVRADVRDYEELRDAVEAAVQQLGRLDLVSVNAAISNPAPLLENDPQSWRDTIDTNVTGAFHTVKVAVPHIVASGRGGSIVVTSSTVALKPAPNLIDYIASKQALIGITRSAALELGALNIRVNSVHPGMVDTPMVQNAAFRKLFSPDKEDPTSEDLAAVTRNFHLLPIPWIESVDVSNAVVFLFSDESRYITGVQLPIEGGHLLL